MVQKLNQILAIEKSAKPRIYGEITKLHKIAQKPEFFYGFSKTYEPKAEGGEKYPNETQKVQLRANELIETVTTLMTEGINLIATKDFANLRATADIRIPGIGTIAEQVPATHLIFLEKQFTDLQTIIEGLPILDEAASWEKEDASGLFKSEPVQTHKTAKIQKPITLAEPTDKHPAQTQLITVDEVIGYWTTIRHSGAITHDQKKDYLKKIRIVLNAVKSAREEANMVDVEEIHIAEDIMHYIFS